MRFLRPTALCLAFLGCTVTAALADAVPGLSGETFTLLENRGLPMSAQDAMERITFQPFVPSTSYSEVGLLPAFHGDDREHPENRGIGYEYASGGHTYVLMEWPLAGGSLDRYPRVPPLGTCKTGHFNLGTAQHIRAFAWTTPTMAFSLQPDIPPGADPDVPALRSEWARLIKRGVCR